MGFGHVKGAEVPIHGQAVQAEAKDAILTSPKIPELGEQRTVRL